MAMDKLLNAAPFVPGTTSTSSATAKQLNKAANGAGGGSGPQKGKSAGGKLVAGAASFVPANSANSNSGGGE